MHRMPFIGASGRRSPREWLPAVTLALLLASTAGADVVVKEKTVSEGLGGFGNGTSNRTLVVTGDKSRSEDEFTYTGRFKTFAGGGKARTSVAITRIDKEVIWNLEPEKKQYTEMSFAQMREAMRAGLAKADEESRKAQAQAQPEAKDAEMTFTVDVKRTGAKETINGFATEQVVVTCTGKPKNPEKGGAGEIRMVMDQWLTKGAPGAAEMRAYYKRLADKLGIEAEMSGINAMARRMYGNGLKELGAKMKDLEGYPIRSTFTIEGSPEGAAAQKQDAAAAQEKAKAERAKAKEAEATADRAEDVQDAKDIGSSAASGSGGLKGRLGGFLARKAARAAEKKAEEKAEKQSEEMSSSGAAGGPLFKVVTEVTSISTSAAPAGSFDIPAGYKLQEQQKKD